MADTDNIKALPCWAISNVVAIDTLLVALTIFVDKWSHVPPPSAGQVNLSATIGWLGVCGAVFIFGSYGILVKAPRVREVQCDCMVFQCYNSFGVVCVSLLIWLLAGSGEAPTLNSSSLSMGMLFSAMWILTQICAYKAINGIGYAVASAIWIGVTIGVSFCWGVVVFGNPVHSWPLAISALVLMAVGVSLAGLSCTLSARPARLPETEDQPLRHSPLLHAGGGGEGGRFVIGLLFACLLGTCNGSLMACLTCFQYGCPRIHVQAYTGSLLAPLAFLPSLAVGLAVALPILFVLYWSRSLLAGDRPQFHFATVAAPALLTGAFWGMGNFMSMYATVYLGQAVGFPLTQCCLIVSGLWGVVYFREIQGTAGTGTFMMAAIIILVGAVLDGLSS